MNITLSNEFYAQMGLTLRTSEILSRYCEIDIVANYLYQILALLMHSVNYASVWRFIVEAFPIKLFLESWWTPLRLGQRTILAMNIDSNEVKPLTNFEVYDFMKNRMDSKDKVRAQQTILYTGMKYFNEKSPCTVQTPDVIQSFIASVRHFNLKKSELLALINNCPTTQVELSVMISDLDTRFTMPQIEGIITAVSSAFPKGIGRASQINSLGLPEEHAE
ncbi:DNA-directed RNA polymerase III subunit RPC9 [Taenia crassiceps]|uniref:DNA-directed RNA polymerase III subunit RPC9 n=1 Tax=Taenia crassiceps TaxID=6207 RepID=A0ABR4QLH4_9CEST